LGESKGHYYTGKKDEKLAAGLGECGGNVRSQIEKLEEMGVAKGGLDRGAETGEFDGAAVRDDGPLKIDEHAHTDGREEGEVGGVDDDGIGFLCDDGAEFGFGIFEAKAGLADKFDDNAGGLVRDADFEIVLHTALARRDAIVSGVSE
jgi:hypothetical protein